MKLTVWMGSIAAFAANVAAISPQRQWVVPQWELEVTPGGEKVVLNGTVQEVHAQLLNLNPNWDEDFQFNKSRPEQTSMRKRTDFGDSEYYCQTDNWDWAYDFEIAAGIDYLRGIGGRPHADGRFGVCARVSCSYKSAISWCNDDPNGKDLLSFGSIADGARYILDRCVISGGGGVAGFVAGQVFHSTNWNVMVHGADC